MKPQMWHFYVLLAGLSWGVYVPIIFFGGSELGGKSASRMVGVLCVGVAYFVIGVLLPLLLFVTGQQKFSEVNLNANGLIFSGLAGAAGAVGAICVIFATKAALDSARADGVPLPTYKVYIAPLIFGLAPVINVLVTMVWHPIASNPERAGTWLHFDLELPGWKLVAGVILVGLGAALVLFSKEEVEASKSKPAAVQRDSAAPPTTGTSS
jgi:hypothetical protein